MQTLTAIESRLRACEPYRRLVAGEAELTGLPTAAAAWVMETAARDLDRPQVVVVPREAEAKEWVAAAESLGANGSVVWFPAPSLTPYQEVEAPLSVRAQEVAALDRILCGDRPTVVCTPRALFRRLPPAQAFREAVLVVAREDEHPVESLVDHLVRYGYHRTDLVTEVGEFAVRGGVFDLFPPGREEPVRLDLFGDTIDSIRLFDPRSQRSSGRVDSVSILPLDIYPRGPEDAARLGRVLREAGLGGGLEAGRRLAELEDGRLFPGWENLLPMLWPDAVSLCDCVDNPLLVAVDPETLGREVEHYAELLSSQYLLRGDEGALAAAPEELGFDAPDVLRRLAAADIVIESFPERPGEVADFGGSATDRFHQQLPRFPREVETAKARGETLVLVAPEENHERVREALEPYGVSFGTGGAELVDGEIGRGFRLPPVNLVLFSEEQLFPRRPPSKRKKDRLGPFFSGLRDLKVGDFVVHIDHGIGQLVGLRSLAGLAPEAEELARVEEGTGAIAGRLEATPGEVEVMEIAYSEGRALLLPLNRLEEIQKYSGMEGVDPRLDRLGGSSWQRTKSRVRKSVRDMARELLKLYAQRELAKAPAMFDDSDMQALFEGSFEFEETEDQLSATAAIKQDLESQRPMDRLLCGDVGFGKTEVATRAAFKVVDSGFQVALLAPTTILADQHFETLKRRFKDFPVTVEMVSRFRTAKEVRRISEDVAEQRVDILVGTHRLLSKDVQFKKLGLVIIDEEQRFGVAQKERLKQLRQNVHVLAMSATPVPRTLQLSIAGVRDLSLIETPPKDRMAVETQIMPYSKELVREAIEFELERGGQVYYVYNQVATIERMTSTLRELIPGLRVTIGHGQMDVKELARRMHAFTNHEYDVLVASTIIENGIDIPNVNTMLVHRAEKFGLAQLYQLRGRVGRSHQLAYCYLLVPSDRVLSMDAQKRLSAIREFSELGAGFRVAARDLEIRGAGNLLGAEQSGHIADVGIETYLRLLEETIRELKGEAAEEAPSVTIDLPLDTSIPEHYVQDTNLRMGIYRRLGSGSESGAAILDELSDRFGPPPSSVKTLAALADLKRLAEELRVQSISAKRKELVIRLRRDARVDVDELFRFVANNPQSSFSPDGVWKLRAEDRGQWLRIAQEALRSVAPQLEAASEE